MVPGRAPYTPLQDLQATPQTTTASGRELSAVQTTAPYIRQIDQGEPEHLRRPEHDVCPTAQTTSLREPTLSKAGRRYAYGANDRLVIEPAGGTDVDGDEDTAELPEQLRALVTIMLARMMLIASRLS